MSPRAQVAQAAPRAPSIKTTSLGLAPTAPKAASPAPPPVATAVVASAAAAPVATAQAAPIPAVNGKPPSSSWALPSDDGWAEDNLIERPLANASASRVSVSSASASRDTPVMFPPMPALPPATNVTNVTNVTNAANPANPAVAASGALAIASLTPSLREEIRMIARSAIDDALAPYLRAQREMEERVDRVVRDVARLPDAAITSPPPAPAPHPAPGRLPPPLPITSTVAGGPPPLPVMVAAAHAPTFASLPPADGPWPPAVHISAPPRALRIDAGGEIDLPPGLDGSRRRKGLAWAVGLVLLIGLIAMIASTVLSHSR